MFHVNEKYRSTGPLGGNKSWGNAGYFVIPHHRITDYEYGCQVSCGLGWEHVSVVLRKTVRITGKAYKLKYGTVDNTGGVRQSREVIYETKDVERCPTWEEMCYIKSEFWDKEDCVIEFHPPEADYVSMHPYCLHLWRPTDQVIPMPDPIMVGLKDTKLQV